MPTLIEILRAELARLRGIAASDYNMPHARRHAAHQADRLKVRIAAMIERIDGGK